MHEGLWFYSVLRILEGKYRRALEIFHEEGDPQRKERWGKYLDRIWHVIEAAESFYERCGPSIYD